MKTKKKDTQPLWNSKTLWGNKEMPNLANETNEFGEITTVIVARVPGLLSVRGVQPSSR